MSSSQIIHIALELFASLTNIIVLLISGRRAFYIGGTMKRFWGLLVLVNFLLLCDILFYVFQGDTTSVAYWIVRIATYVGYFLEILILMVTVINIDAVLQGGEVLRWNLGLSVPIILLDLEFVSRLLNPVFHHYYHISPSNQYIRGPYIGYAYLVTFLVIIYVFIRVLRKRKSLTKHMWYTYMIEAIMIIVAITASYIRPGITATDEMISICILFFFLSYWLEDYDRHNAERLSSIEHLLHEIEAKKEVSQEKGV